MIRVPFCLLFGFNTGPLKQKGQKGNTQEPRVWGLGGKGSDVGVQNAGRGLIGDLCLKLFVGCKVDSARLGVSGSVY